MAKRARQTRLRGLEEAAEPTPTATRAKRKVAESPPKKTGSRDKKSNQAEPTDTATAMPDDLAGKTVYVVDANSLIFQVFHAIPEMTSPRGEPVNAVYGFTRDLLYLLEEKQPDYLFYAFDLEGPTFRHELFETYKGERGEVPDDLIPQFEPIRRVLEVCEVPALEVPSFEADDILATLAREVDAAGGTCMVVTGDKDCRQLISDRVAIYNIRRDEVFDAARLAETWNIRPDQVVDFQSLVGDKVDNVPGVPLIGPKIAGELLAKYGTLDDVLANAEEVAGKKRRENLIAYKDQALLSRELVRLRTDVPVTVDWAQGRRHTFDRDRAHELFVELGFRSFAARMKEQSGEVAVEEWQAEYRAVTTLQELEQLADKLAEQELICVDTETTHVWPVWAELVGIALACQPGEAYYVPVRAPQDDLQLDVERVIEILRPVLENPAIRKIGQNLKYDIVVLRRAGVALAGVSFDTMLASYLLEAGQRNHNLDDLSQRYLQHTTTKISELIGTGKNQKRMDEVPLEQVAPYAAEDVDVPLRLMPLLEGKLNEAGLSELLAETEIPLIDVLADMELTGVRVDVERLKELSAEYGQRLERLEAEIYELAGGPLNIASPKQLQEVLFTRLELPVVKRTKTGPSTDADVLEQLAKLHPLPAKIIEYRQFAKLKNTYVDALPKLVHQETKRVHCSFNQVVAATGRLSSSDPNLQNIPIRTDRGREIRSAFLPGEEGWRLLAADYSQIELRVLAHFSGDETLHEAFEADEDIHALVASQVHNVALADVTSDMRRQAKAVNFGVIYGQSAFGLARQLDIPQDDAQVFIDAYFDRYPGVEEFLTRVLDECRAAGYVTTILGRRRAIQGVRADAGRSRNLAERTAINTVIQGSAADLIKQAMVAVRRRLQAERLSARMLLQIHDELVFEVPVAQLERTIQVVDAAMTGVMKLDVPLKVDIQSGQNWAEV